MISTTPSPSNARVNLALATLFLCTFVLGTAELGVVGMIDLISADLGSSLSATGALVTAYALGLAVGGPILAALTIRIARRPLLLGALALYIAMTLVIAVVGDIGWFAVARVLAGASHGLFVGVAFTVAVSIAPPEKVGRAISAVIGGFAVSVAFGVPLGALVGQLLGWRDSFLAMVALGVLCVVAAVTLVPAVAHTGSTDVRSQMKYAFAPRVLAMLGLAFLVFAGQYATFTYITPFLQQETGISGGMLSGFLLAYGVATAVGVFGGGRFAATAAGRTIVIGLSVVALCLLALWFVRSSPVLVAIVLVVWGVFGFGIVPSLQFRIVNLAGPGGDLASTLPASAINVGIAVGALAGGGAVAGISIPSVALVGLVICAVGVPVAVATAFLRPPAVDAPAQDAEAMADLAAGEPTPGPVAG